MPANIPLGCTQMPDSSNSNCFSECPSPPSRRPKRGHEPLYYAEYLGLKQLLSNQNRRSAAAGNPAHDEHLFIVIHQTYELWFKQILFELDSCLEILAAPVVPEKCLLTVVSRLKRITEIQRILLEQLRVLETMTPGDFLGFRDYLFPASGFQSVQFKLLENKLGLLRDKRLNYNKMPYCSQLSESHKEIVEQSEHESSLFDLVERWLESIPLIGTKDFCFWEKYSEAVNNILNEDENDIVRSEHFSSEERSSRLDGLSGTRECFQDVLDEERYGKLRQRGKRRMSYSAFKMAISIHLLCNEPPFQMPFQILTLLVDIDELLTQWRCGHAHMVHRMLGLKIGTGGSSGYRYLNATVTAHKIFSDFNDVGMYLIPSACVPAIPEKVLQRLHLSPPREGDRIPSISRCPRNTSY